jgi:NDP-sugar pyrophosphorylase family protein
MKAVLLAAGKGTRLKPLTDDLPKVMIPANGKPILEYHVEILARAGIEEVFINLHYLPEAIPRHFGDGARWGVRIQYSYEPEILGTAGAVGKLSPLLRDGPFLVVYGDNYLEIDLPGFIKASEAREGTGTVAVFEKADVTGSGILELDKNDEVVRFKEKPTPNEVFSHWVNAGIFYLRPDIFDHIPAGFSDFGLDVVPSVLHKRGRLYAYRLSGGVWAIDDLDLLNALNAHLTHPSGTGVGKPQ